MKITINPTASILWIIGALFGVGVTWLLIAMSAAMPGASKTVVYSIAATSIMLCGVVSIILLYKGKVALAILAIFLLLPMNFIIGITLEELLG